MSEHGWPDHDDPGFDDHHDDVVGLPGGDPDPLGADPLGADLFGPDDLPDDDVADEPPAAPVAEHDDGGPDPAPAVEAGVPHPPVVEASDLGPVGADPDAAPEPGGDPVFPPPVDVGPLPEPVDGFPWIDTGSLGLAGAGPVGAGPVDAGAGPVDPQGLAEYAAEDLPPGVDPWAALADSDDPATAALARWWAEHGR
jgi:hypothetical protein